MKTEKCPLFYISQKRSRQKTTDYKVKMREDFKKESLMFDDSTELYLTKKTNPTTKWIVLGTALLILTSLIFLYICSNE